MPDFRAGERALAFLWAAAERVGAAGQVIIQSQHPSHYAFDAVARQDLAGFYKHELKFRAELGYPPFRRLAFVTARGRTPAETAALAERASAALAAATELTVYPPLPDRRERMRRIVVKGRADLPRRLEGALASFREGGAPRRGIIDVEVDPLEWPF
jgi:primosomal protein N' (replication factor Y)